MRQYRVKPGCRFGAQNEYKPGDVVTLPGDVLTAFGDKLEAVEETELAPVAEGAADKPGGGAASEVKTKRSRKA
jgi:hypothetical protein